MKLVAVIWEKKIPEKYLNNENQDTDFYLVLLKVPPCLLFKSI